MSSAATRNQHLSIDLLTRALDEELSTAERFEVEGHLSVCELCRTESESLHRLSADIESVVDRNAAQLFSLPDAAFRRHRLQSALEVVAEDNKRDIPNPGRVMKRFGWGMGIAATLAFGILLAPRGEVIAPVSTLRMPLAAQSRSALPVDIEVDGESFTSLPYSNPDLPVSEEHIVQMQVPVSSLTDMGIILEPVVSRADRSEDATVLADVLLGSDGQPRGVHVLGSEQ